MTEEKQELSLTFFLPPWTIHLFWFWLWLWDVKERELQSGGVCIGPYYFLGRRNKRGVEKEEIDQHPTILTWWLRRNISMTSGQKE